jgi:DNA-binding transcriptional ArsR family regulator
MNQILEEKQPVDELDLGKVMQALADPCRRQIIETLMQRKGERLACCEFNLPVSKATASHHFQILQKAGLIQKELEGTKSLTSLRVKEIERRFPGLWKLLSNELDRNESV